MWRNPAPQTCVCVRRLKRTNPRRYGVNGHTHVYVCFCSLEGILRKDEERGWWEEKERKEKKERERARERERERKINLPHSAVLQPLGVCECVSVGVCAPSCRGATKWSKLIPVV